MRLNRPVIGFIAGVLAPAIGFFFVFALRRAGRSFDAFIGLLKDNPREAALNITLAVLVNFLVFTYFTNRRLDYAARGVFSATILFFALVIYLRFLA